MHSNDFPNDLVGGNDLLVHILPWIIFAVGVFGIFHFLIKRFQSQCPSCGKPWRRFAGKKKLGEGVSFQNEMQQTDKVDANGQTISVPVKVPYLKTDYRYYWNCSGCGNEWSTIGAETRKA